MIQRRFLLFMVLFVATQIMCASGRLVATNRNRSQLDSTFFYSPRKILRGSGTAQLTLQGVRSNAVFEFNKKSESLSVLDFYTTLGVNVASLQLSHDSVLARVGQEQRVVVPGDSLPVPFFPWLSHLTLPELYSMVTGTISPMVVSGLRQAVWTHGTGNTMQCQWDTTDIKVDAIFFKRFLQPKRIVMEYSEGTSAVYTIIFSLFKQEVARQITFSTSDQHVISLRYERIQWE